MTTTGIILIIPGSVIYPTKDRYRYQCTYKLISMYQQDKRRQDIYKNNTISNTKQLYYYKT